MNRPYPKMSKCVRYRFSSIKMLIWFQIVNGFHGYKKNRFERYFVSGIRKSSTEADMREYLQGRNVLPTFIKFFSNPNFPTMSAQMNVASNECKHILRRSFWPWGIRIRKWIPRNSFYPRKDNGFKE
jgi:hypothetical protein